MLWKNSLIPNKDFCGLLKQYFSDVQGVFKYLFYECYNNFIIVFIYFKFIFKN